MVGLLVGPEVALVAVLVTSGVLVTVPVYVRVGRMTGNRMLRVADAIGVEEGARVGRLNSLTVGVQVGGMDCGVIVQVARIIFTGAVGGGKGFTAAYGSLKIIRIKAPNNSSNSNKKKERMSQMVIFMDVS